MRIVVFLLIGYSLGQTGTEFYLYSPNQSEPEQLVASEPDTIRKSQFNTCFKTLFLITGHLQPRFDPEIVNAAKVTASKSFNAIVVNYNTFFYIISVPYTGIDPSGPFYDFFPWFLRLDRSDAPFIDTLHSSIDLGTGLPRVGHVRFILDGGVNQPGCSSEVKNCSHLRSAYFTKSSLSQCVFTFQRCYAYVAFKLGLCKNYPTLTFGLGMNVDDVTTFGGERYYHDTTERDYPFCKQNETTDPPYTGRLC